MSTPEDPTGPAAAAARVPGEIGPRERWVRLLLLFVLLYGFLTGIDALGDGLAGLGGNFVDALFQGIENPLVGLFAGTLTTVLVQSSSVTTSTIVSLVGTGVIGVGDAVPLVMGANLGTTITNTLASLGSIRRTEEFRRAFAGATMHDFFNVVAVVVMLPLEIATGFLSRSAIAISGLVGNVSTGEFDSPLSSVVSVVSDALAALLENLLGTGVLAAVVLMILGLALIFATLVAITKNMRVVIAGAAERSMNAVLERSGALGILVGAVLTVAVQSSSITTSLLIPMIAAGVLSIPNAYPVTLGANIGTTVTALLASLAVDRIEGLQIALVHLLFNIGGVLLLYPVPALRRIPLRLASALAGVAAGRRTLVMVYILLVFYVLPLVGILVLR